MKGIIAVCLQRFSILVAVISAMMMLPAHAATYTYDLSSDTGTTGVITTNCDNCVLNAGDITAWSFASPFLTGSVASTAAGAEIISQGSDMVAKPNAISFGFGLGSGSDYIGFLAGNQSVDFLSYFTFASGPSMFPQGGGELDICSSGNSIYGSSSCGGGVYAPAGSYVIATSKRVTAPEIDPASGAAGLTLLLGTLAVMCGRRRRATAFPLSN